MQKLIFDDEHGSVELALTPKAENRLYVTLSKKYRSGGGWFRGPDAMLTKDQATWIRDQLNQWLESLQEGDE